MRFLILAAFIVVACGATPSPRFDEKSVECDLCKFLIKMINDIFWTQDNADEAIRELEAVCAQTQEVSSFLGETCTRFVEEIFKPEIEDILANKPNPEAACKEFTYCV